MDYLSLLVLLNIDSLHDDCKECTVGRKRNMEYCWSTLCTYAHSSGLFFGMWEHFFLLEMRQKWGWKLETLVNYKIYCWIIRNSACSYQTNCASSILILQSTVWANPNHHCFLLDYWMGVKVVVYSCNLMYGKLVFYNARKFQSSPSSKM